MTYTYRHLVGFKSLLRSIEFFGISSVHGINYFGRGVLPNEFYTKYIRYDALAKDLLNASLNYVPSLKNLYQDLMINMTDFTLIKKR